MTKRCKNCGWPNDDNNVKCEKCGAPMEDSTSAAYQSSRPSYQQTVSESSAGNEHLRKTVSESQFFGGGESRSESGPGYQAGENQVPVEGGAICPNCGYPAREGATVCMNCGTPLSGSVHVDVSEMTKKCVRCGYMNSSHARYCNQCGSEIAAEVGGHGIGVVPNPHGGTVNPWMNPENGSFCTLKPIAWVGENMVYQPQSYSGESIVLNRANTDPNNQSITSTEQAELTRENGEWYIVDKSAQHTTYVLAAKKTKLHKGDIIVLGNRLFEFN